jgi:hypothetical protein
MAGCRQLRVCDAFVSSRVVGPQPSSWAARRQRRNVGNQQHRDRHRDEKRNGIGDDARDCRLSHPQPTNRQCRPRRTSRCWVRDRGDRGADRCRARRPPAAGSVNTNTASVMSMNMPTTSSRMLMIARMTIHCATARAAPRRQSAGRVHATGPAHRLARADSSYNRRLRGPQNGSGMRCRLISRYEHTRMNAYAAS